MIHVITGGSGSGKSRYAEQQILELGDNRRVYLATMCPYDEESYQRIERHRAMRAEKKPTSTVAATPSRATPSICRPLFQMYPD